MRSLVRQTPLLPWPGAGLVAKLENLQRTGSFKLRGAWTKLSRLPEARRAAGVVTASAGNHGAGLALAAAELGITARVVIPEGTPGVKRSKIAAQGAQLVVHGAGYDEAAAHALALALEMGATWVSPYDDEDIIEGNGSSLARELLSQMPAVARVVAPVGGGGLVAGLARVLVPRGVEVVGAQPSNNCAMYESLRLSRALTEYNGAATVAEGCEGAVAERTYRLIAEHGVRIVLASEDAIERSVARAYREMAQVVECSAGVAVAVAAALPTIDNTVVIVSGGNIDDDELDSILRRYP